MDIREDHHASQQSASPHLSEEIEDSQLILLRAADACRRMDDLRGQLHAIQEKLRKHRQSQDSPIGSQLPSTIVTNEKDEALASLLQEAYTLQFQLSILLASTEEPIPPRKRKNPGAADPSLTALHP